TPDRIATPTHIHWLYLLINKQKTSENDFRGLRTTCAQVYIASKIVFLLLTVLPAFHWIHRLITSLFRALPKHCFIGIGWTFHPSDTIGMVVLIREKLHDCFVIYVSRSEERRVGKEWVCRWRQSPSNKESQRAASGVRGGAGGDGRR